MFQFGGKGPCGHWDYTFFLELVQACDFFGRKIKFRLKHTLSTAVERDNPTRLLSPFCFFPSTSNLRRVHSVSNTLSAFPWQVRLGLCLEPAVRPRSTFFLTTATGASAFLFFPISATPAFFPSAKALFKTAPNEDEAKHKKNVLFRSYIQQKTFFFWKTEKESRKKRTRQKNHKASSTELHQWKLQTNRQVCITSCVFFQIRIRWRKNLQTNTKMRPPELYKSMKIFTRKNTVVILELSNPNPRAGFLSVLPVCGLFSTFTLFRQICPQFCVTCLFYGRFAFSFLRGFLLARCKLTNTLRLFSYKNLNEGRAIAKINFGNWGKCNLGKKQMTKICRQYQVYALLEALQLET